MPSCKTIIWKDILFQLLPKDNDIIRNLMRFIPYFWGNEIMLDLAISFPLKKGFNILNQANIPNEKWTYYWEVCGKNKKVICNDQGILNFDMGKKSRKAWGRKYNAVKISEDEELNEGKYKIYIKFANSKGEMSDRKLITSFSIRNKDDYLSAYLLPAIIALVISIIVGLVT
jgi:hypothetical protein